MRGWLHACGAVLTERVAGDLPARPAHVRCTECGAVDDAWRRVAVVASVEDVDDAMRILVDDAEATIRMVDPDPPGPRWAGWPRARARARVLQATKRAVSRDATTGSRLESPGEAS